MKRILLVCLLLGVGAVTMPSCAGHLTPVASVASPAAQVEQTGDAILKAAQAANATTNPLTGKPVISTAQLDQVALVVYKLGTLGTSLAQGLTAYSAAKAAGNDTTTLAASIQQIIASAVAALGDVGKAVPSGTVQAIDQAVAASLGLYLQLKATVL